MMQRRDKVQATYVLFVLFHVYEVKWSRLHPLIALACGTRASNLLLRYAMSCSRPVTRYLRDLGRDST